MSQHPIRRDSQFPSTSISRVQGAHLQRTDSHESLSAHPLLAGPGPSATQFSSDPSTRSDATLASPKYVPYTPRHRPPSTYTSTSSTTAQGPQNQGDATATGKLQFMNMKFAAQALGVDAGSVGWLMLEQLVASDTEGDWAEIWQALTIGQATLLLPLEQALPNEVITPDLMKDHIILNDGASHANLPIITLSGLRGVLSHNTFTLSCTLAPSSKPFQALLSPTTRASALSTLPPLPESLTSSSYLSYAVPTHTPALPLPPRPPSKQPLPSTKSNVRSVTAAPPTTTSRLANPFASLFGKAAAAPATPVPARPATPPVPGSPASATTDGGEHVVEISASAISRRILFRDVAKTLVENLMNSLSPPYLPIPTWATEKITAFATPLYPFVPAAGKTGKLKGGVGRNSREWKVNDMPVEGLDDLAEKFQVFYVELEEEWRKRHQAENRGASRKSHDEAPKPEKEAGLVRIENEEESEDDRVVREFLETVEGSMCTLFYDRLFCQPTTDDASHDEALSSRIAALNMLDLDLEHLDVIVGDVGPELDLVVKACGETMAQLKYCLTPADKIGVLLAAHRVVVDGLSKLPPIRLRSEADPEIAVRHSTAGEKSNGSTGLPSSGVINELKPLPPIVLHTSPETTELSLPITETQPAPISSSSDEAHEARSPQLRSTSLLGSPPNGPTPVSGDILLPILIFSVVKANPPQLVSHLLFTQRFRNRTFGGEGNYCLINLMAVAEFLEDIDLAALGLAEGNEQVKSTADLKPIPIHARSPFETPLYLASSLRGRVDVLAGSANKVISGVVDTSVGVFRSLLPGGPDPSAVQQEGDGLETPAPWNVTRPGFGLLRRESAFSIASIAASLPGRGRTAGEEPGRQMVAVTSREPSVKSGYTGNEGYSDEESGGEEGTRLVGATPDARSIRSFESMMKGEKDRRGTRKSLSDRLAHMHGLSKLGPAQEGVAKGSPPPSRRSSVHPPVARLDTPISSGHQSPFSVRLSPPIARFMECREEDLKVGEVGELLREYRRLVEGIRAVGGFDE